KNGEAHQQTETGAGAAFNKRHHLPLGFSLSANNKLVLRCKVSVHGWLEEIIQPACEAGRWSASPRRWRSRAWGTEPNPRPSLRSGRQMKHAQIRLRLFISKYRDQHLSPASQAL